MISPGGPGPHRPAELNGDAALLADEAEKVAADRALFERLKASNFDKESEEWRVLAYRLAKYGTGVLVVWAKRGLLRSKALKFPGGHRLPEDLKLEDEDARSLVNELLVVSLERFRTKSLPAWELNGGSSLSTWFINQCLFDLPDVFARWERLEAGPVSPDPGLVDDGRYSHCPDDVATARVMLDEVLENDPDLRQVLELQDAGYSREEIANALGQTVGALRSWTNRSKNHIRNRIRKEVN